MNITRGQLDSLYTGFKLELAKGLGMANLPLDLFAMIVSSATAIEKYPFMYLLSTMREWVGERQIQNFEERLLEVINKDFEHTLGISRNDLEDEQIALIPSLFQKMGQDSENHWGKIGLAALVANGTWIDGKAFFAADRKFGDYTIKNYVTGALSAATYATARLEMMSYQAHNGDTLGIVPDTLMVGPKNEATGKKIVENPVVVESVATGESAYTAPVAGPNPNYGTAKLVVHPGLVGTYDDYWFLMQTTGVAKPVIVQKRKVGQLVAWDQEHDENVKRFNRNDYGIHHRGAAALTVY